MFKKYTCDSCSKADLKPKEVKDVCEDCFAKISNQSLALAGEQYTANKITKN